LLDLKF